MSAPGVLGLLLSIVVLPTPAAPQALPDHEGEWATDALGEVAFAGLNALVGALTAGVWQEIAGRSFEEGFAGGALGGSVAYVGKRIAAEHFPGAGFLGRDVAAVGSSVVRDAADGRPLLDSLALPVGPLRVHLSTRAPGRPRLEADLAELYWTAYGLTDDRLELDPGESLSSGMAVFDADRSLADEDGRAVFGVATGGSIFLSPLATGQRESSLAHERAHILQLDFVYDAWTRPLEDHLARLLPADGLVERVDWDVVSPILRWGAGAAGIGDPLDGPMEAEAEFLEGR